MNRYGDISFWKSSARKIFAVKKKIEMPCHQIQDGKCLVNYLSI